uniref:PIN domain-containing protein n=1 Tax=Candidatus Electronema sp. TaxID=2698783 RepID=UPI00405776D4
MAETARMILCDTNILIEFYKNNLQVVEELRRIGKERLAVSAVTQAELYFGAINKNELRKIRQHLALLHHLTLDIPISTLFLQLMETYSLSHKLSLPDALIAATTLSHDLELYTLNIKDFRFIAGLNLYRPAA